MSNFVVSARKYRPNQFEAVVGQEHVAQTLKNALKNDHLAHAFLFCGPRGVGKTTCARILAKVLNCRNSAATYEPCGTCDSCQAFEKNASFNIMELDAASNNSVEHIRTLVEQVRFQPQQGQYKVFIIDEVHMLSPSAFNAFLKTLEEPPSYAIFILATTEKHKIIPTILSRCQIFDFKRIQIPQMVAHLEKICAEEGIQADKDALHIIGQKADGALRDALSIFDRIVSFSGKRITYEDVITNLNILDYDYYFKFTDAMLLQDAGMVLSTFDEILRRGFDGDIFLNGLGAHLRDLLVCKDERTLKLLEVSEGLKSRYYEQARLVESSFILTALNLINECDVNYKMARNKRLHVEMALLKMTFIQQATELAKNPHLIPEKKKLVEQVSTNPPKQETTIKPASPTEIKAPEITVAAIPEPSKTAPQEPASVAKNQEEVITPKLSIAKSSKFNTPKMPSLDALDEEIAKEESADQIVEASIPLNLETVEPLWEAYRQSLTQMSSQTILKSANLTIRDDMVVVRVGSSLAKNTVQQERGLVEYLRKGLKRQNLEMMVEIDPEKAAISEAPKRVKPLTDNEKYHQMKSINPLVDELRKQFDLTFD